MRNFFLSLFQSKESRIKREYAEKTACYEAQLNGFGCSLMNLPLALEDVVNLVGTKSLTECEVDAELFKAKLEYHNFALTSSHTHMAELDYPGQQLIVRYCLQYTVHDCITSAAAVEQIIPSAREMGCSFYQAIEAAAHASHLTVEEVFGIKVRQ
ncbi:hypothetical protein [Vagococcus sp. WN89Y]|uniref:hypothetical protein n=1 Tax=Vagococcus sp. WN89Y TaxID=3457258 RepID=UPI003FCC4326